MHIDAYAQLHGLASDHFTKFNYNSQYEVLIYPLLRLAVYFTDGHLCWSSCVISRKNDTLLNRCMGVDLIRLLPPFGVKLIYIVFIDKNFVFYIILCIQY